MGTYYPELEGINQYETEDNRLNDYGQHNEAHIDNMIQRYKRLTVGSFDPDNVKHYEERLNYWQNRKTELAKPENVDNDSESGIMSAGKSPYSNEKVFFNPEASFNVSLPEYSENVNNGLSRTCRIVANMGMDDLEHLKLVDLNTGEVAYFEDGTADSVGYEKFWNFLAENKDRKFAFVHNHNTATSFSETDMRTLLDDNPVEMFIVSRRDGIIYVIEKKEKPITLNFDELFKSELEEINKMSRAGEITAGERTHLREEKIVSLLIKDYTKGVHCFE